MNVKKNSCSLGILVLLLAVFVLSACNKEASTEGGGSNAVTQSDVSVSEEDTDSAADESQGLDQNSSQDQSSVDESTESGIELLVYCGAGLKKPMNEIAQSFTEQTGIVINYTFAGSAQLLSQAELAQTGDAMVLGSLTTYNTMVDKGEANGAYQVAYHIPVIGVPKDNPSNITSLEDMAMAGVKVMLGDENANAIGKSAQKIIEKTGLTGINDNVVSKAETLNELGVHLSLGDIDAAIITQDLATTNDEITMIEIPEEQNAIQIVPAGTLTFSENPQAAEEFVEFVASDEGKWVFEKYGFPPVDDE